MKKFFTMVLLTLVTIGCWAYDAEVGGIYYNLDVSKHEASVTYKSEYYKSYSGSVTIPSSITYNGNIYSVKKIDRLSFCQCSDLTSVTIPNSVVTIGQAAFSGCSYLATVDMGNSISLIESGAFANCTSLTSITIPNSVDSIGGSAFDGCTGLKSVHISNLSHWCSIKFGYIQYSNPLEYAHHLYLGEEEITNLVIPDDVSKINNKTFYGCSGLLSVTIPNTVTEIGECAFEDCTGLTSITIPNSVTSIEEDTFYGCTGIASVNIGNSVTSIGNSAFYGCTGLTSLNIPNTVCSIGSNAFNGCTSLTSITLPNFITSLSQSLFRGCVALKYVTIPSSVTTIERDVFTNCSAITTITIPNSVKSLGAYTFYNCTGLTSITLPNSVTNIGDRAFCGCSNLASITMSDSVTSIGSSVFYGTQWYSNQPDGLIYTGKVVYEYKGTMPANETITIKDGTVAIKSSAFYNCTGLKSIEIPNSVTNIGSYAFAYCSSLTSLNIPTSVNSIGLEAFRNCTDLTEVTIPNSVKDLGSGAFSDCSNLNNVTISESVSLLGTALFYGCTNLKSVIIPNSVTWIDRNVFAYCTGLESISIGNSVTKICDGTFFECTALKSISCTSTTPPTIYTDAFTTEVLNSAAFYVPKSSIDAYKSAEGWKNFANINAIPVKVSSVALNNSSTSLILGNTTQLIATVLPENVDNKTLEWSSSDTNVATVSDAGLVTAIAQGTTTITAKTTDGTNLSASCEVTVTEKPIEDTDLSKYPNVLYIDGAEGNTGSTVALSLKMNNQVEVTGFQCDVYAPNGTSIEQDEDDFYLVDLSTARTTAKKTDYFNTALQSDGGVRILCSSTKNYTFSGNEGEVATISLKLSDSMADGDYPLILKNIVLTDANGTTYKVDYVKTTLKVSSYTLGDANGDTEINVGDFASIASYIMGTTPTTFIAKAADVNKDNEINVGDLASEANIILYGSGTNGAKSMSKASMIQSTDVSTYDNVIYSNDVKMNSDRTVDMSFNMKNSVSVVGYQFDIELPTGISVAMEDEFYLIDLSTARTTARKTDYFNSALQTDGSVRVLCSSTKNYAFSGNDGEVATATLNVANTVADGKYSIVMKNIVLTDANGKTYKVDKTEATLTVGNASAITNINVDTFNDAADIYSVDGVKLSSMKQGLNIIKTKNGEVRKVVVK